MLFRSTAAKVSGVLAIGLAIVVTRQAFVSTDALTKIIQTKNSCVSRSGDIAVNQRAEQLSNYHDLRGEHAQQSQESFDDACIYITSQEVADHAQDARFDSVAWLDAVVLDGGKMSEHGARFDRVTWDKVEDVLLDWMMPAHVIFKRATSDGGMMQFINHQLADIIDDAEYRSKQRMRLQGLRLAGLVGTTIVALRALMPQPPQDGSSDDPNLQLDKPVAKEETARRLGAQDPLTDWPGERLGPAKLVSIKELSSKNQLDCCNLGKINQGMNTINQDMNTKRFYLIQAAVAATTVAPTTNDDVQMDGSCNNDIVFPKDVQVHRS